MLFDQPEQITRIDPQDMLSEINALPDQLEAAWALGKSQELPDWEGLKRVVIAGMGGSAIGADLLAAYAAPYARLPVWVLRQYELPAWAAGSETLVIGSSHSGNTEETISVMEQALERGCRALAVTTGGRLAEMAADNLPLWRFEHHGQPRAAVGYSFALLLSACVRLGLLPEQDDPVAEAVAAMRRQAEHLKADVPAVNNPGKRYAGQLMGRWFTIFGAEFLAPVARRWKTQVNELAKAWAQFEILPEADHNALAGTARPEMLGSQAFCMFLVSEKYNRRNRLRMDLTRKAYMLEGVSTDFYQAQGESRLAHQWTALHFGDYVAYYLAIAYQIDPTPVEALANLKAELNE
jgi:glucose/mannose-6-phosphate isomerase